MSLSLIRSALSTAEARALNLRMSLDAWAADQAARAAKVKLFREYAEGDHRAELTPEMAKMLRVDRNSSTRFNDNYMDIVISTMGDRLTLTGFETDVDAATAWAMGLCEANRFDALQGDTTIAALRDADTYLMASWDNDEKRVVWTHEPAYDGSSGMLVHHDARGRVQVALKVWQESRETLGDTTRVTVYYADRIERYISGADGGLMRYEEPGQPWPAPLLWNGQPVGVPVVHIPNRGSSYDPYGMSEIENAIPLQDALNRTLYSMVMTAELTGFGVRWAKGFKPPAGIMPGTWIVIGADGGLDKDQVADVGMLPQGEIMPYIQQAQWLTAEIGKITRTPAPEFMGSDNASGESLKQREIGLLGKVRRFQVNAGNRWEDFVRLSWRMQAAFGSPPPEFKTIRAVWDEAELRNDKEVVENAKTLVDMGLVKEALRQMAPIFKWDSAKIDELYEEYQEGQRGALSSLAGNLNLPPFEIEGAA